MVSCDWPVRITTRSSAHETPPLTCSFRFSMVWHSASVSCRLELSQVQLAKVSCANDFSQNTFRCVIGLSKQVRLFLNGTIKTVHTIETKMSLTTTRIYCTISPPLSGAMKDCSIVRVQQLQMLYCRRCCMSASQHVFLEDRHVSKLTS